MPRLLIAALACGLLASGCTPTPARDTTAMPAPSAEPAPRPQVGGRVPANAELVLRLDSLLSSDDSRVGDLFTASLEQDYTARSGEVILPAGTAVTGMVTGVDDSDHPGDPAAIRLNFLRIDIDGINHPFSAVIIGARVDTAADTVGEAPARGAIIGDDSKEALLGTALSAGAGTIIALGTGDVEAVLPVGTRLVVRTRDALELR